MMIYLDNNATTQSAPEVVDAVHDALVNDWANPSSAHALGQKARHRVELARSQICRLLGCREREVVFTAGATEAGNLAIRGIAAVRGQRRTIVTTATEHPAVREPCEQLAREGYRVVEVPIEATGVIQLDALAKSLDQHADDVAIVTIQWANNETGVIQPVQDIGRLCRKHGVPFCTDGAQAVGKVAIDLATMPIEAMSFSAHKFHGPKGTGGLYVRSSQRLKAQMLGGHQERQRRSGTEATPVIVGMGMAAELATEFLSGDGPERVAALRDRLESGVLAAVPDAVVNAADAPRLWNTTNIGFPPLQAEAMVFLLSERGVCAAAGAACASGSLEPSRILVAMGVRRPVAHGSIRLSLSRYTTEAEIDQATVAIGEAHGRLSSPMCGG